MPLALIARVCALACQMLCAWMEINVAVFFSPVAILASLSIKCTWVYVCLLFVFVRSIHSRMRCLAVLRSVSAEFFAHHVWRNAYTFSHCSWVLIFCCSVRSLLNSVCVYVWNDCIEGWKCLHVFPSIMCNAACVDCTCLRACMSDVVRMNGN